MKCERTQQTIKQFDFQFIFLHVSILFQFSSVMCCFHTPHEVYYSVFCSHHVGQRSLASASTAIMGYTTRRGQRPR